MISTRLCFVELLLASFLLGALSEEATECLNNTLNPDYEDADAVMTEFSNKLEHYTGFNTVIGLENTEPFSVTLDNCGGKVCVVNPNGNAIWDARMELYRLNLMVETNETTSLDGCLCYSKDLTEYRSCMTNVRNNMLEQLDTILVPKFRTIVESDCSALAVNCVAE